jgi:hypothetical protein
MRSTPLLLAIALGIACTSDGTGPRPDPNTDGARLGSQPERLADSVAAGDYSPAAEALRHAAEVVRLTGHATPVTVSIDDRARAFLGVAEQIDFPNLVCRWPGDSGVAPPPDTVSVPPPDTVGIPPVPPDTSVAPPPSDSGGTIPPDTAHIPVDSGVVGPPPECHPEGTYSMRTLIAWEPVHLAEVVRLVAYLGSSGVQPDVPDVMTGLPGRSDPTSPTTPPDSGSGSGGGPGGFPGFMGEYLVPEVGRWYASAGQQANDLIAEAGACTADRATFDWAEFGCRSARFRFEFSMQVEPGGYGPATGDTVLVAGPEGRHGLSMDATPIDGVRLTWVSWSPPPPYPRAQTSRRR